MKEYISINEFAKLANKSPQAIYKQLNNRLNQYVKLVDNQKMLSIQALSDIFGVSVEKPVQPKLSTYNQPDSNLTLAIEALQKQLEAQNDQLKEKDKQLAALHRLLEQQNALALGDKQAILQLSSGISIECDTSEPEQPLPEETPAATKEMEPPNFFKRVKQFLSSK